MKVCHVIPLYEPVWASGVVSAVSALCRGLARRGIDVSVYTMNLDVTGSTLAVPVGIPVEVGGVRVRYYPPSVFRHVPSMSYPLLRGLKEELPHLDVVHVAAIWQYVGVQAARLAHHNGVPLLVSAHGSLSSWSWKKAATTTRQRRDLEANPDPEVA